MTSSITAGRSAGCLTAERFLAGRGLLHRGRPLKRWRYVGLFGSQLMACAARVQIGPAQQTFWALHVPATDGAAGTDREHTRLLPRRGELELREGSPGGASPGRLLIRDRGVELDVELSEQHGVESRCANGRSESWTRKQAGVAVSGTLRIDGRPAAVIDALAVIDDSAGYHERRTEWRWSAGVGHARDGAAIAWNLVSGINDPPQGSERAVWIDGAPHEVGPVEFAADLSSIRGEDGSLLRFSAEAERSRHDNLLIVSSEYRAPFGSFSGTLPGGVELAGGRGVMEHHRARW
jgi:hypothetical protein